MPLGNVRWALRLSRVDYVLTVNSWIEFEIKEMNRKLFIFK